MEPMNSDDLLKLLQSMASGGAQLPSLNESQFRAFMAQTAVSAVKALEAMVPSQSLLASLARLAEDEAITADEAVSAQEQAPTEL